jgi:hypothetical protein
MIRIVLLFLVLMAVIGVLGKLRRPSVGRQTATKGIVPAHKCSQCGTYLTGEANCDCTARSSES